METPGCYRRVHADATPQIVTDTAANPLLETTAPPRFTGITPEQLKDVVATGATDKEIAKWITNASKVKDADVILKWNNTMRDTRLSDMSLQAQQYLEEYIPKFVPNHHPVYVWFDVYDLEEKRI